MIFDKKINMIKVLEINFALMLFIIFLGLSSLGISLSPLLVSLFIVAIILIYPKQSKEIKIIGIIYSFVFLVLLEMGMINFDFIPQAKVLLERNENVFYWFSNGHIHAIRLLVAYPGFLVSKLYKVDLNVGFTYYGMILFIFMYFNIANTISKLQRNQKSIFSGIKYLILIVPLLILPLIMNGRLILSYLGYSILICLYTDLQTHKKINKVNVILMTFIGLVLTMVSSGTMAIALLYVITMLYSINFGKFNKKKFIKTFLLILLVLSPIIIKVIEYVFVMINKNITFFGGGFKGFFNMLNHGLGKYFNSSLDILIFFILLAIIFLVMNYKYLKNKIAQKDRYTSIILGINIAMYGLLFGFSTGLMMIPPLIIYILIKL